jgi:hypothetical protein
MRMLAMVGLLLVPICSAAAQSQGTELSVRIGGIGYESSGGNHLTSIDIGNGGGVGLGVYLSSGMAVEPSARIAYLDSGRGSSATQAVFGLSMPIYVDRTWGHSGVYFAPGIGLRVSKYTGGSSRSQFSIGGEVGTKLQLSDPVSLRIGVTAADWFKKSNVASSFSMTAFFGVSVFLKKS